MSNVYIDTMELEAELREGYETYEERILTTAPFLLEVLSAMKKKQPEFTFKAHAAKVVLRGTDTPKRITLCTNDVYVYMNGARVGRILERNFCNRAGDTKVRVAPNNHEFDRIETKVVKRAVKHALETFHPLGVAQVAKRAVSAVDSDMSSVSFKYRNRLEANIFKHRGVLLWVMGYMKENLPTLFPSAPDELVETLEYFPYTLKLKRDHVVVTEHEGKYVVCKGEVEFEVFSAESLPEELRRKLGLLKLVAPQTTVVDVGRRTADNVFVFDVA